jgi:hypothetical protein
MQNWTNVICKYRHDRHWCFNWFSCLETCCGVVGIDKGFCVSTNRPGVIPKSQRPNDNLGWFCWENLQETMLVAINELGFPADFPLNRSWDTFNGLETNKMEDMNPNILWITIDIRNKARYVIQKCCEDVQLFRTCVLLANFRRNHGVSSHKIGIWSGYTREIGE